MRAWLIIGLLAVGLNQSVPKQADKPHAHQDNGKHIPNPPPEPAAKHDDGALTRPSPQEKKNATDAKAKESDWCEKLLSPPISNWPLVLVAICGISVARGTLKLIAKQTKATEDAAIAARDSADAVIRGERAWLLVNENVSVERPYLVPLETQQERRSSMSTNLKNFGKTPAKVVASKWALQIGESRDKPDDETCFDLSKEPFAG